MSSTDPENARVILATDCGSTTTKAILIQLVDGVYRQTHRGEAPTTVEAPFADVTIGVVNAVTEVQELAGRRLIGNDGRIIHPATDREGCDIYISTSSAGGGLQMMVAGVVREMTGESAKRAALGAGAIVMDVIASNDRRKPHEQIQRIRELRPDIMLISGGVDGGTTTHVVQIAELVAPAKPRPRFGDEYRLPIIYAGNKNAAPMVRKVLEGADGFAVTVVDNLRPVLERENLGPARDAIHDLFLEHVMAHAPGYDKLMKWTDAPIMPTPGAVGNILQTIADRQGINVVGVDIGGATTDVFSVFDRVFNRTVSANLGMSYSISNVCAEAGMPNILRWVPFDMDVRELSNRVKNKMIRPTTIPQTIEALVFEQAVAREALRLAYIQHKEFATTLKGVQQQRSVGDTFSQQMAGQTIVDNMKLDLLVASGGVLSHAPRMHQTAMMLIDAFEPEGFTALAKDSIFMMPHLGVLAQVNPKASLEVFERDCLIYLGSCVAAKGTGKAGKPCFRYSISSATLNQSGQMMVGDLRLLPLGEGEKASVAIEPDRAFDVGAGPGKPIERDVRGGTVGLILDARGRPLSVPVDRAAGRVLVETWVTALQLYPQLERKGLRA
jgi:uncharacterized protein (TIGR01319 family)